MEGLDHSLQLSQPISRGPTSPTALLVSPIVFTDAVTTPPLPPPLSLFATPRSRARWWWWRWWHGKVSRSVIIATVVVLCSAALLLRCAVQYRYRQGPFMLLVSIPSVDSLATQLSPPLDVQQVPFLDLCLSAEVMEAHVRRSTGRAEKLRRRQLDALMDRYNHIPAHGGDSAIQWSAATGLPVAYRRWGGVRARFLTVASELNDHVHIATTAATMTGVRLEILGRRWRSFDFHKRVGVMLSYVKHERLTDADVVVGLDSDALMAGEDVYSFLEAFVASTASSETEHLSYAVRDIRLGRRLPPVLFSSDFECTREQITKDAEACRTPYRAIAAMMAQWAASHNATLPSGDSEDDNPLRFLNTGVFVARVWALRLWNAALLDFVATHKPRLGRFWWCDQSSSSTLFLELRRWELLSHALDGLPRPLQPQQVEESFYPPLVLPTPDRGPHGLPAGLIGYDRSGRFVLTFGAEVRDRGVFRIDEQRISHHNESDMVLDQVLRGAAWQLETSLTGVVRSTHRLRLTPREGVDCYGVQRPAPECACRDALLGISTEMAGAVTPLIWHFAGAGKRQTIAHYRGLFPWYTPAIRDAAIRNALLWTLLNAPPTRVFVLDRWTDVASSSVPPALLPHAKANDLSFFQMCRYRFYQGW